MTSSDDEKCSSKKQNSLTEVIKKVDKVDIVDSIVEEPTKRSLKRFFKFKTKELMERAESLNTHEIFNIINDGDAKVEEEDKEENSKKNEHTKVFRIEHTTRNRTATNMIKITVPACEEHKNEKEEKKGEVNEQDSKKIHDQTAASRVLRRAHSHNHKEEVERSLKDFSCIICMEYMVGAKKLQCGH